MGGASIDRFIVGTGRCGSTLLSRMLGCHPEVLSLFEFFTGLDWGTRFGSEPITGDAFARLVCAEQPFVTAVLRRGYSVEEITYPFEGTGRYRRDDPLPWVLVSMLPRLTDDPDALYDELLRGLESAPSLAPVTHYRRMFDWLGRRLGRADWIERSGSSIEYAHELARLFPSARFVHLHRDGPETALSMREHHAYRLPICLLYDAPLADGTPISALGALDLRTPPTADDPISRILSSRPPAEYFGRYWNDQVVKGMAAIRTIPTDRVLSLRFEDLVRDPQPSLARVADFFDLDPQSDGWIEKGAALVRGAPPTRVEDLGGDELTRLINACAPASRLLDR